MPSSLSDWLSRIEKAGSTGKSRVDLTSLLKLYHRLGLPSFRQPVVTVTGTNGKGSTVAMLDAIYRNTYQVGRYMSPHLLHFTERIAINGMSVSEPLICDAFEEISNHIEGIEPFSFFDWVTFAAFLIFSKMPLDVLILEVGIGGRLDPINLIDADVAIITSIGFDHMDRLGYSREEIGFEKAGIFRKNAAAICGEEDIPSSVAMTAQTLGTRLFKYGKDFCFERQKDSLDFEFSSFPVKNVPVPNIALQNAASALAAVQLLQRRLPVSDESIRRACSSVQLPGRCQVISFQGVEVLLDVSHNGQAVEFLAEFLREKKWGHSLHAVVGMFKDKDIKAILSPMIPWVKTFYVGPLDGPRPSASVEEIQETLKELSIHTRVKISCTVRDAFDDALRICQHEKGQMVVFGSFHTVRAVMQRLDNCNY